MIRTINCPACGTKTDARRRTHCPRCRAELAVAPGTPQPRRRSHALIAIACVLGVIVTAGVFIRIGTSGASVASASTPGSKPSLQPSSPTVQTPAGGVMQASSIVTSMDLSRAGLAAYAKGDVAGSVDQLRAALEADPSNAQALNTLGQLLVRSGRAREAIPYFDRAVVAAGSEWTYHFNRAKAYGELQEWGRAANGYRDAARLFPDDYATAFNLARALQASGDMNGAIDEYQRAINLAPGEPDFPLALAHALEGAGRPADAIKAYQRYLELQDSGSTAEKVKQRIQELESKP